MIKSWFVGFFLFSWIISRRLENKNTIIANNLLIYFHKYLVEDIVHLQWQPGQCEESHHHHQHLYNLYSCVSKIKLSFIFQTPINQLINNIIVQTFFLLFITAISLSSWAAPGVLALHRATAILQRDGNECQ